MSTIEKRFLLIHYTVGDLLNVDVHWHADGTCASGDQKLNLLPQEAAIEAVIKEHHLVMIVE